MSESNIKTFKDLIAWKKGHILVIFIYDATKQFPQEEQFGLSSQMRRCAVSVTSNIAEGFSRKTYKEKSQFYSIALGSVTELQNQIQIAFDVNFLNETTFLKLEQQATEIHKIINGLIKSSKNIIRG